MALRIVDAPTPNFNERLFPLDMLVLHYTGMADGPSALARLLDPAAEVSAHYLLEEDGTVFALAPEERRAWHAGRSWWRGDDDLNSRSIGIEIVNGGHDFGLPTFPDAQMDALIELCRGIRSRWDIPQTRIVGHSDIAPDRKDDPGERFPWKRLADAGIGLWPTPSRPEPWMRIGARVGDAGLVVDRLHDLLARIGYRVAPAGPYDYAMAATVRAFQRRWRQGAVTGEADEETLMLVDAVAALSGE